MNLLCVFNHIDYVYGNKMSNFNETSNEPILYELLEYFVRKQEPELIVSRNSICADTSYIKKYIIINIYIAIYLKYFIFFLEV